MIKGKIKDLLRMIRAEWLWWQFFLKAMYNRKNKMLLFLFMTPQHGNLGDQAITLAEYKFLKDIGKDKCVVELYNNIVLKHLRLTKWGVGSRTILIQGGGFIGTLWMEEEQRLRKIITEFKNNKIIIFPQSVYFEDTKLGERVKRETTEIFNLHDNVYLCTRERLSFAVSKELFKKTEVFLVPDMVPYLESSKMRGEKDGILYCMRRDHEKVITDTDLSSIQNVLQQFLPNEESRQTDTFIYKYITPNRRKVEVYKKIEEFSKAKLVVTDRLHGMVFAALAGTPCLALGNCNYKIKGVYDWIKDNRYIAYVESLDRVGECLDKVLSEQEYTYSNKEILPLYRQLEKLLNSR